MRILLIHNQYRAQGGEDMAVTMEMEILQKQGHEVLLLLFNNTKKNGIYNKLKFGIYSIWNPASLKRVKASIVDFRPHLIHVHNIFFDASPSVLKAASLLKVPVVMTLHNYRLICANALLLRNNKPCTTCTKKRFPLQGIFYKCYRGSAFSSALVTAITGFHKTSGIWQNHIQRFILLTEFSKKIFLDSSLSIPAHKISIKPNYTADYGGAGLPRNEHYLFVGRLSKEKGLEVLLNAFHNNSRTLFIIGDGPEMDKLKNLHQHQSNIQFLGKQSSEEVIKQLKTCKAMVFPSLWYEGLPFSIIEAFSTGTPVIASNLGAMQELITHGYNGLLFKAGDPIQLNNCLDHFEEIVNDGMYENAQQTYLQHFTAEKHYQSIINIYKEVIEQTNGPHAAKE